MLQDGCRRCILFVQRIAGGQHPVDQRAGHGQGARRYSVSVFCSDRTWVTAQGTCPVAGFIDECSGWVRSTWARWQ